MVSYTIIEVLWCAFLFWAAVYANPTPKLDSFTNSDSDGLSSRDVLPDATTRGNKTGMSILPPMPIACRKESRLCAEYHPEKSCHCDDICLLMNDCCDDHITNTSLTEEQQSRYYDHLQCQEVYTDQYQFLTHNGQPFLMIKTCPFPYSESEDVRTLCENKSSEEFLNWPVTSRVSHVTFRNLYCSICWGESDVFYWKVSYDCEEAIDPKFPDGTTLDPSSYKNTISSGIQCEDSVGFPASLPEDYDLPPDSFNGNPGVGSSEPANYPQGEGFAPELGTRGSKIEAALAPEVAASREKPAVPKRVTRSGTRGRGERNAQGIPPSDVVTPLPIPTGTKPENSLPPPDLDPPAKCELSFVFQKCKNLRECDGNNLIFTCPPGYKNQFMAEQCRSHGAFAVKVSSTEKVYKNQFCAFCNGHVMDWASYTSEFISQIPASDGVDIPLVGGDYLFCHTLSGEAPVSGFIPTGLSLIFDPRAGVMVKKNMDGSTKEVPLPQCGKQQIVDVFSYTCRDVLCPKEKRLQGGTCVRVEYASDTERSLNVGTEFTGVETNTTNTTVDCTWERFNEDEYTILQNESVFVNSSEDVIHLPWWLSSKNSSILICDKSLKRRRQKERISLESAKGPAIISLICTVISLICLAIQFIIYLILPEMRNIPGLIIMNLVAALFLAQLLLLVGSNRTENVTVCTFFAALIHYFFLATFFWMNALAFSLTLTFSTTQASFGDEHSKTRHLLKFCIYGWGSPFIIVSIALILDALKHHVNPYNPGYAQGFCWITNFRGWILFFQAPIALLLLSCIIMYAITVYHICRASREAELVRRENKCNLLLYIKLSIIMGLTWILAYIWMATRNTVMEYAFIVVNDALGAFIFAAFSCRKKVYRLLQKKLKRQPQQRSSNTTTTGLRSTKT